MKNVLVIVLLFCLVTLNLPKAFFHEHDHEAISTEQSSDYNFAVDDAHCFVCDIDLSNFSFSIIHTIQFDPKAPVHAKELEYFIEPSKYLDAVLLRGPPTII